MIRYYRFADICIALEGMPECVPDSEYLQLFRTHTDRPDLEVTIYSRDLVLSQEAIRIGNRFFIQKNGKKYLYSWFRTPRPAILFSPEDWSEKTISIFMNSELSNDSQFTVNQFFSLAGFHSGLLWRGCGIFHCSYIVVGDRAVLFAGGSGSGKSTQAKLWNYSRGAQIINGDRALIFLRKDGWYAGGISFCGSSEVCVNRTAKIAAMVLLEKKTENKVCSMSVSERYRTILTGLAFHRWDREEMNLADKFARNFIEQVPMYRFCNLADLRSVDILEKEIGGNLYDI